MSGNTNYSTGGVDDANSRGVNGITDRISNMTVDPNKKSNPKNGGKNRKSKQMKLRSKKYKGKRSMKTRRHRK